MSMDVDTMDEQDDGQSLRLGQHLEKLVASSKIPAKRRDTPVKPTVETITTLSSDRGIAPDDLVRLVDLVTAPGHHLDQATLAAIIRNLYPIDSVPESVVLAIVGSLGHGQLKPSLPIQSLLLRWLIMVFHVLDSRAILLRCYPVLFNLLDTAATRPQVCHLLALITRRRHVRPFRIRSLLELSRQTGHDPSLVGLLRIYKNYYPEVIVGDATKGKASPFKYPDPEWRERLEEIQSAHRRRRDPDNGHWNRLAANLRAVRRKGSLLPPLQTSHAKEDSVTLEEIDSVEQLVANLENIELPNQLVAILADPWLQKLLQLRPDAVADQRVNHWLESAVADAAGDAQADGGRGLLDLSELVHDHAQQVKTVHPIFDQLFHQIYLVWNGRDRRHVVLNTLSYTQLRPFPELYENQLRLLENRVLDDTAESQLALLEFYTSLLRRWKVTLLSLDGAIPDHAPDSIAALAEHVDKLCLRLVQQSPPASTLTHMCILGFYNCTAGLLSDPGLMKHVQITAPPSAVVYALAFSDSPVVLSVLCSILARYKRGLQAAMAAAAALQRPRLTTVEREHISVFNSFFMDMCNCLWRGRALERSGDVARGCGLSGPVIAALEDWAAALEDGDGDGGHGDGENRKKAASAALRTMYGVSRSPALCLLSKNFLQGLEEAEMEVVEAEAEPLLARHAGPATQQSLARLAREGGLDVPWQEYRLGVLDELSRKGFKGVPELLYQSMKGLMSSRAQAASDDGNKGAAS